MGSLRPQLPFHEMPCSLFSWSHVRRMEGSVCSDRTEEERGQARSCPCSGEPARERRAGISGRDVADPSDKVQSTAKDVPQQLVSSINLAGNPLIQEPLQEELVHCTAASAAATATTLLLLLLMKTRGNATGFACCYGRASSRRPDGRRW